MPSRINSAIYSFLFEKIKGHELEEIRERALENLISKLVCKILDEAELAQCKQLFIKLFELFNFADFKQHEKVLNLLLSFSNVNYSISLFLHSS